MNSNGCKLCQSVQDAAEKQLNQFKSDLETTRRLLEQQREIGLKLRIDFLKETTNLREIIEGKTKTDNSMVSKLKTSILVKFFDDTDGLDSKVTELLNERLGLMRREQERVLIEKETLI